MAQLGPEFIDITWNAGGITSDLTIEVGIFCFSYLALSSFATSVRIGNLYASDLYKHA
jgi:hypothetical protein